MRRIAALLLLTGAPALAGEPCEREEAALAAALRMTTPQPPVSFYRSRLISCRDRQQNAAADVARAEEKRERAKREAEERERADLQNTRDRDQRAAAHAEMVRDVLEVDALVEAGDKNADAVATVWSAYVCSSKDDRAGALTEIAAERKYGRIGGVVDAAKLHQLQDLLREADENLSWARGEMRRKGIRQRACTGAVARVAACLAESPDRDAHCDDRTMVVLGRIERDVVREGPPVFETTAPPREANTMQRLIEKSRTVTSTPDADAPKVTR